MKTGFLNLFSTIPLIASFSIKNCNFQQVILAGIFTLLGVIISTYKPFLKNQKKKDK